MRPSSALASLGGGRPKSITNKQKLNTKRTNNKISINYMNKFLYGTFSLIVDLFQLCMTNLPFSIVSPDILYLAP